MRVPTKCLACGHPLDRARTGEEGERALVCPNCGLVMGTVDPRRRRPLPHPPRPHDPRRRRPL